MINGQQNQEIPKSMEYRLGMEGEELREPLTHILNAQNRVALQIFHRNFHNYLVQSCWLSPDLAAKNAREGIERILDAIQENNGAPTIASFSSAKAFYYDVIQYVPSDIPCKGINVSGL